MASNLSLDFCPYKGLAPYTEKDRAYFFGRDRDQEIITSNLYASHLTVLYGASGVGKSSVLLAGVVPQLRREPRIAVVVFRNWQDASFVPALKQEVLCAVRESMSKEAGVAREINIDESLPLDDFLAYAARSLGGPVFLIFDQFEEYFLYHPLSNDTESFEAEFARAVNRRDVDVNFLLSLREDGLSKLDRFQGRIPTLLSNMLRLEHLDRAAAKDAITKPLDEYNRVATEDQSVTIGPGLMEALLHDLGSVDVASEQAGQGAVSGDGYVPIVTGVSIETPFLQMVLTRLWEEEKAAGSRVMRIDTFVRLGRAENIAKTHLDKIMEKLTVQERVTAANVLRYLVTPSGSKIAQEPAALVSWAELKEEDVEGILRRLSASDTRILRTVQAPGQPERYEIFHDVIAQAILDWRTRYEQEQDRIEAESKIEAERVRAKEELDHQHKRAKRSRLIAAGLALVAVVMIVLAVIAFRAKFTAQSRELSAFSSAVLEKDPELSLLLAIEAINVSPTNQAQKALKEALNKSHVALVLPHKGGVRDAAFNRDGSLIATASLNDAVKVWDSKKGTLVKELQSQEEPDKYKKGARGIAFSPDGKYLVATNNEGGTFRVWDVGTWQPVAFLRVNQQGPDVKSITVYGAAFSPDGNYLVTSSDDVSPQVWKVGTWEQVSVLQGTKKEKAPEVKAQVETTVEPKQTVAEQPSDATTTPSAVVEAKVDGREGHTGSVYCVDYSPDGKHIVTGGQGNVAWLWQAGTWQPEFKWGSHRSPVYGVGFSRDSKFAVTASYDRSARVFDVETGKMVVNIEHSQGIYDAAFNPAKDELATACWDGIARIFKLWKEKKGITEFRGHSDWIYCVAYSSDGNFLLTGSEDRTARVWRTTDTVDLPDSPSALLALAKSRVTRQLTPDERKQYLSVE